MKINKNPLSDRMIIILSGFMMALISCNLQNNDTPAVFLNSERPLYTYPLKEGQPGSRCLYDQDGRAFFWLGDAAWSLIAQLDREDAGYYLDNRKQKGFSVILVSLIEHKFCTGAPANYYGEQPFTGRPFTTPNEKYFKHADYVIESAARRNILVLLAPLYLGYDCRDEGWCAEVRKASGNDMYAWGKFLGERYKKFSNILWIIGGDTDPEGVRDKVNEMVRGIRENDTIHLFTAHNQPESMAVTPWTGEKWLTVNNVYSYDSILYRHFKTAYDYRPVMPFYLCESAYENEHSSTPGELRSQAYEAILSGAMGHIFGNCPVWHFGSYKSWCGLNDWKRELDNSGSLSMYYFQRLFTSRSWQNLIPDYDHTVITSGYGTWGLKDYVTASRTQDGNTIIAYVPAGRTITANLAGISGRRAVAWWYDPSDGKITVTGTFKTRGSKNFTSDSCHDQVLVIDNSDSFHK